MFLLIFDLYIKTLKNFLNKPINLGFVASTMCIAALIEATLCIMHPDQQVKLGNLT